MSSNGQPRTENHGLGHRHGGQGEKSVWSNPEHAPHERGRAHHPHYGDGPHGSPAKSGDAPMAGVPAAGKPRAVPCAAGGGGGRAGVLVEAGHDEEGEGEAEVAFDVAGVGGGCERGFTRPAPRRPSWARGTCARS